MKKLFPVLCLSWLIAAHSFGGSATWSANPISNDWDTAENWTPNMVPNGRHDIATFDVSNATDILGAGIIELDSLVFNPGASAYTLTIPWYVGQLNFFMTFSGAGIVNNSGVTQNFVSVDGDGYFFSRNATAGEQTVFVNTASDTLGRGGGFVDFLDGSNAGSATFVNEGDKSAGGSTLFIDHSSAANATVINLGELPGDGLGGAAYFLQEATAGTATFINNGGAVAGAGGGYTQFDGSSSAADSTVINKGALVQGAQGGSSDVRSTKASLGNATFIADGTFSGIGAGRIFFTASTGGAPRIELFGTGTLEISSRGLPLTVGSLEGDGLVFLGSRQLTVGNNNLNTTFSGVIQDGGLGGGSGGSLLKIGTGSLTLAGVNTYTGGTTIGAGKLVVKNTTGSATGTGPVQVSAGGLAGRGIIAGAVVVGSGSAPGALVAPGQGKGRLNTLTIESTLTFNSGIYECGVNSKKGLADKVVANGVTITEGRFLLQDPLDLPLVPGTELTVIDNTSASPISGTFANLSDNSTLMVGQNTYQANYEGGDGNDLTLTVVP